MAERAACDDLRAHLHRSRSTIAQRPLIDDCLRCHGMHFEGGIRDLVTPLDGTGPWRLIDPRLDHVRPFLAFHATRFTERVEPLTTATTRVGARQEIFRPSLALFDRRCSNTFAVASLPLPAVLRGRARGARRAPTSGRRSATSATRPQRTGR